MTPVLPSSLSPHICILPSPDLDELLNSSSLPPLPVILQSFSPLPQVTTRTTALTPVPHSSFALRFSDLEEIEAGCREDEEQRAGRTIDWISARISSRCAKWLEDWERSGAAAAEREGNADVRTPWWEELKRCAEGEHVPNRGEGWNHPVAIVIAVSTMVPNPLQTLAQLHSRPPEFPPWVDNTYLRYTLIVHPSNSPLSDEEAGALFNAVKKQYGLQSYLLPLNLPSPPPAPVPVPLLPPRLPSSTLSLFGSPDPSARATTPVPSSPAVIPNTLRMSDEDIQSTARFLREFVAMNLVPWMEKCVLDWNENFSSTRRLPSRLFSSTRRLFGSATTQSPTHSVTTSISSVISRTHSASGSQSSIASVTGGAGTVSQQRRLAEFATILGDYKLAVSVWEGLRKDGKGGSDVLPMLLSPSPALQLHVVNALNALRQGATELSALSQLRALVYAVRWETSINPADFLSSVLEGDRWLVWAANSAEEPPSAMLLAHAATLSMRKHAFRRASLWYLFAATKLEKSGIRPLTTYFLQRARELYQSPPGKSLSPSFWDAEGIAPTEQAGFDAILPGIEHALGRLHYTTGDTKGAVKFFLGLLRGSTKSVYSALSVGVANGYAVDAPKSMISDKVFLEDFRVAFQHFLDTSADSADLSEMKLPVTFCVAKQTRVRLPGQSVGGNPTVWDAREETWRSYRKSQGKEGLRSTGKAPVNEMFWVDLSLHNPLDVDINLSDVTVLVREAQSEVDSVSADFVEVEVLDDIALSANETRTIPIAVKATRSAKLQVSRASYKFLSILPASETLATRGRRLQDTALQRQSKMYAPDTFIAVDVEDASQRLSINFVEDQRLVLAQGECKRMRLWASNVGTEAIDDVWLVSGDEDEIFLDGFNDAFGPSASASTEILHSNNSLNPQSVQSLTIESQPGSHFEFCITLHAENLGEQELCLLLVYRQKGSPAFRTARVARSYEVRPLLSISTVCGPSKRPDHIFRFDLEVNNLSPSTNVVLQQVTTISPTWICSPAANPSLGDLPPNQSFSLPFSVDPWEDRVDSAETLKFVSCKLQGLIRGEDTEISDPPPIELICSHTPEASPQSVISSDIARFIHQRRRNFTAHTLTANHPDVLRQLHSSIFPLYNPFSVDILIFWRLPTERREGHLLVPGLTLGARHGELNKILDEAAEAKVKRSMYAETQREKSAVLEAIRVSEWNAEMNPIVVALRDMMIVEHDFSEKPCHVSVDFTLRNLSLTHPCKYKLVLPSQSPTSNLSGEFSQPTYVGRLTYRGTLKPLESVTLQPTIQVTRPDTYALGSWRVETEVFDPSVPLHEPGAKLAEPLYRYIQGPSDQDHSCITVVDVAPH